MRRRYSLVHLSDINCPPPDFIRAAAAAGYDAVSLRTIPMGLKGEKPHDIAADRDLFRETRRAVKETGIIINDTENARIFDGVDILSYEPALEAAAELGIHQILTNIWTDDRACYTEKFAELCDLAAQYEQTVNVEFVTWASVKNLEQVRELLEASGQKEAGVVLDFLHYYRSRVTLEEVRAMPPEKFRYVHLCDAEAEIPTDEASLIHTGRAERLYPGEGAIPMREVMEILPDALCGIEVPHLERVAELGLEEHARRALCSAKKYLEGV
ncbi:MAG: sugar phosphate isomerase/epimerase [Lachnospiraceae bacterium]|nr:sugar phosphate isomerase/epimerase [Lachnospiraceae bacterium]